MTNSEIQEQALSSFQCTIYQTVTAWEMIWDRRMLEWSHFVQHQSIVKLLICSIIAISMYCWQKCAISFSLGRFSELLECVGRVWIYHLWLPLTLNVTIIFIDLSIIKNENLQLKSISLLRLSSGKLLRPLSGGLLSQAGVQCAINVLIARVQTCTNQPVQTSPILPTT